MSWYQALDCKLSCSNLFWAKPQHGFTLCAAAVRKPWERDTVGHDQVLKTVAESICSAVTCTMHQQNRPSCVTAGVRTRPHYTISKALLATAPNWQLMVDLESPLQ